MSPEQEPQKPTEALIPVERSEKASAGAQAEEVGAGRQETRGEEHEAHVEQEAEEQEQESAPEQEAEQGGESEQETTQEKQEQEPEQPLLSAETLRGRGLYERLGVSPDATPREIKSAYRRMARKYHPDVNKGKTEEQFKAVGEAYDILSDSSRRHSYDRAREQETAESARREPPRQYAGAQPEPGFGPEPGPRRAERESRFTSYDDWKYREEPSPPPRFYGFATGPLYERPLTTEDIDYGFEGFFRREVKVGKRGGKYYAVNESGFAVSPAYDLIFELGIHRFAKQEDLVYFLNELAEELSAPYEEFRLEGDALIGREGGLDYVIDPETGQEASPGFERIFFKDGRLIGQDGEERHTLSGG